MRYFTFNFCNFCIHSSFCSSYQISGIFLKSLWLFVLRIAVVTNQVTLGVLFSISAFFVLWLVSLTNPLVLGIFLSTSPVFFSRPYLSKLSCVLKNNAIVLDVLVSRALTLVTKLLHTVVLDNIITQVIVQLNQISRNSHEFIYIYIICF